MDDANMLRNAPQDGLARLVTSASDALTDSMVERLSITGANAMEVVDRLNDEQTREAVHTVIDRLTELHRTGALQTLFDLVSVIHSARNAMTDSIVERLFAFIEHMINNVATEEMATLADNVRISMDEALIETQKRRTRGGLFRTMFMLTKPETQKTLNFFLLFGERFMAKAVDAQDAARAAMLAREQGKA